MRYERNMTVVGLALSIAIMATSVAACSHEKAWRVTGESLAGLGNTFADTGRAMDAAHEAKRIDDATYRRWAAFAHHFKALYDTTADRWLHGDETASEHAAVVLAALSAELAKWTAESAR